MIRNRYINKMQSIFTLSNALFNEFILCFFNALQIFLFQKSDDAKSVLAKYYFSLNMVHFISLWLSRIILKVAPKEVKLCFRKLESILSKVTEERTHLAFNEDCLQHQLLPISTNIYVYIQFYTQSHVTGRVYV